jgi:hypothetical protein
MSFVSISGLDVYTSSLDLTLRKLDWKGFVHDRVLRDPVGETRARKYRDSGPQREHQLWAERVEIR